MYTDTAAPRVSRTVADKSNVTPELLVTYTCSRLGRRANPPRGWLLGWLRG